MNYSDMIQRSFRSLKSGGMWGFVASTQAVRVVVLLVVLASFNAVGESSFLRMASTVYPGHPSTAVVVQLVYFTAVVLASILCLPANLILQGGLTHLSDEVLAGRKARTSDGWRVGGRRFGRVFVIEFVVGLIAFVAAAVCSVPLVVAVIGGVAVAAKSGNSGLNPVPAIAGACCGYLVFFVLLILLALFTAAYGSIAVRYGVIGGRTSGDALGSAWKALRARKKNVFVFSLIQLGFGIVWAVIVGIVGVPVQIATAAGQKLPTLSHLLGAYAISGPLAIALVVPFVIFSYAMWTAFFRQMTGLDVAPTPMYAPPRPIHPADNNGYPQHPPAGPMMANMLLPTEPTQSASASQPRVEPGANQPGRDDGPAIGNDTPIEPA
ncbi:MAG: hypothetical protein P4L93_04965 [Coriobacteriia bacterium]|nr:hypothetical protein [Coriobacteriia bacterium]